MLIRRDESCLVLIDLQERLVPAIAEGEAVVAEAGRLAAAAQRLGIPIFATEQYPEGIGGTVPGLLARAPGLEIVRKTRFDATAEDGVRKRLDALGRDTVVLAGVEAHVCILQTAFGLWARGCRVFVVADAVGSRRQESRDLALRRLERADIGVVTVEMVIFEWLERAGTPEFRELLPLIK